MHKIIIKYILTVTTIMICLLWNVSLLFAEIPTDAFSVLEISNSADITELIDNVYITKSPLCCPANGNVDGSGDGKVNLADITSLIDHVYISKDETAVCE